MIMSSVATSDSQMCRQSAIATGAAVMVATFGLYMMTKTNRKSINDAQTRTTNRSKSKRKLLGIYTSHFVNGKEDQKYDIEGLIAEDFSMLSANHDRHPPLNKIQKTVDQNIGG
eukprot:447206_1